MKDITIRGAREHNLQDISVTIPRYTLTVITGLSGSGKSTLAFDTIYAEGQRRYVESLSAYARQFLGLMNKPDVDSIDGLSPAIAIEQKSTSKNPRSTVGTVTEIYDHLRLLFARIGIPHCPEHGVVIAAQSPSRIAERIGEELSGMVTILAPIIRKKKGTYQQLFKDLNQDGFTRVRVNGEIYRTDDEIILDRQKWHYIDIVVDRVDSTEQSRITEAIEVSLARSDGLVIVVDESGTDHTYSSKMACPICGLMFEELEPRMFSFNSPFGACPECNGLGFKREFDPDLIIPDKSLSMKGGAIAVYRSFLDGYRHQYLNSVAEHFGFTEYTPIADLTLEQYNVLMYGSPEEIKFDIVMKQGTHYNSHRGTWEGLLPQSERLYRQTESEFRKKELERFTRDSPCSVCHGKRLKDKILAVHVHGKSIIDITDLSIADCRRFFYDLQLTKREEEIGFQVIKEIRERLTFLEEVGLSYLTLSRNAGTLSGGEAQRIRLATQIGSNLVGVLYVLDEPSIGLHQRDNNKLITTLKHLRDIGNTLIVVEHDEETIMSADFVIDMGPGAGIHGGEIVSLGTPADIEASDSLTGQYLSGKQIIALPKSRRSSDQFIHLTGCKGNNLNNIDVSFPVGSLTLVTGVSGSGKSTLIYDTLYKALQHLVYRSKAPLAELYDSIVLDTSIDKVIVIDQSPIGRTPRSNPATYTKVFDEVRTLFAQTREAKMRGYAPGRFSFNVRGGRCEACEGDGVIKIEMNFLPDVYVTCEECKGARYNRETLEVLYRGKSIADVLAMSVDEALEVFENVPKIVPKLKTLSDVGLGYIKLGQNATTLSGGEAQRIKLTRELAKRATGKTIYLLDEPTTGLHFHDVRKLIDVLNRLVEKGNTVIVIEHNLDVIKSADYIIDLGPDGGNAGGNVVVSGTPEEVAMCKESYTGQYLAPYLAKQEKKSKKK